MIPFSKTYLPVQTIDYIKDALTSGRTSGDHAYTKKCHEFLRKSTRSEKVLLTTSGTHALEMAALLAEIKPDDEVIMPSYTFSSTANAFALRGARIKFVDVDPSTMNVNIDNIMPAINKKTKAICVVHYAGVSCDMDPISDLCLSKNITLIEDAAQAINSKYKNIPLGTIGNYGCLSFHETKNISCGEGGAIIIKDAHRYLDAEIIREKGTNRSQFFRGETDKYSWRGLGSSFLPSDLNAAALLAQLESMDIIHSQRADIWEKYFKNLLPLQTQEKIVLPKIPDYAESNHHIFFIKLPNLDVRSRFISFMKSNQIQTPFHYVPLHSSEAGQKYGEFVGEDKFTTQESERLARLPLYPDLSASNFDFICQKVYDFFKL